MNRALAAGLLFFTALSAPAAQIGDFRYWRAIDRGAPDAERIVAVEFDSAVYAGSRDGFPDLRVFQIGEETPFLVERVSEPKTHLVRRACGSRTVSLHETEDSLEVIVETDAQTPQIDAVVIRTPLRDFERRVAIAGSKDGQEWTPLAANALLFDYSRYMDIANAEIRLPKNDSTRFKITISGIADEKESPFLELTRKQAAGVETERIEKTVLQRRPFRIERIELYHETTERIGDRDKTAEYPPREFRIQEDAEAKTTIVTVRTQREPLTRLLIETPSRNFSRAAVVQKSHKRGDRTEWLEIGSARLGRVDFGGYQSESLAVTVPETREEEYRIVIRNEDNPPLKIAGVKAEGNVYRAVFLAAKDADYRLAYGSDDAKPPKYDAAAVLAPLRRGNAAVDARLGPESINAAAGEPADAAVRSFVNNRFLLGGIALVLVAALGWALFRAMQRINQLPQE